ncbi:MAG: hypothetical protein K6L60_07580 [Oceanobacter sp.]
MIDITATFITFFAVVDPIGTIPVFIAVTSQFDEATKHQHNMSHSKHSALLGLRMSENASE